jgi:hypothetical protein
VAPDGRADPVARPGRVPQPVPDWRPTITSPAGLSPITAALEMLDVNPHNPLPPDEANTAGPTPDWLTLMPRALLDAFDMLMFRPWPMPACVSDAASSVEPALLCVSWSGTATPSVAWPEVAPPVSPLPALTPVMSPPLSASVPHETPPLASTACRCWPAPMCP